MNTDGHRYFSPQRREGRKERPRIRNMKQIFFYYGDAEDHGERLKCETGQKDLNVIRVIWCNSWSQLWTQDP